MAWCSTIAATPGLPTQGRAERAQPVAPAAAPRHQLAATRRPPAAARRRPARRPSRGASSAAVRGPSARMVEQAQPDAGQQHLRVDEAGAEIEQRARPPPRDRPRQREAPPPSAGSASLATSRSRTARPAIAERRTRRGHASGGRAAGDLAQGGLRPRARQLLGQEAACRRAGSARAARPRPGRRGIESTASATRRSRRRDRAVEAELLHRARRPSASSRPTGLPSSLRRRRRRRGCRRRPDRPRPAARRARARARRSAPAAAAPAMVAAANSAPVLARW